ncbi:hypothetical protein BpHYR1_019357 [Brachionus plicatilis]|uniref:Uncharacterized protein n=1 Tax=Brachionus plicatilis TaxID=10195 RepID=A0A3M7Q0L8_BRAPC|nr:hypothetical protein BpHYR1_019357 [Brachionus plicatilis]
MSSSISNSRFFTRNLYYPIDKQKAIQKKISGPRSFNLINKNADITLSNISNCSKFRFKSK